MYIYNPLRCIVGFLTLLLAMPTTAYASITFKQKLAAATDRVIDVRPGSQCAEQSIPRSTCLPIEHLLAGQNRLANFSGLFWLLGTMGLDGTEHVAIVGDKSIRREFIAGWLFISGQSNIDVITKPMSELLEASKNNGPGRPRSATRTSVYTAHPRTNLLILKPELIAELDSAQPPALLDGRTEGEYWGWTIQAARGGHLPGALHQPSPTRFSTKSDTQPVAYAQDNVTGLAYFARLTAQRIDARLFLGGWIQWASDGSLPVDAETYAIERSFKTVETPDAVNPSATSSAHFSADRWGVSIITMLLLLLIPGAYWLGRTRRISL